MGSTATVIACVALATALVGSPLASAQRATLGADVYGSLEPNAGLVVLHGSERSSWLDADALVWAGGRPIGGWGANVGGATDPEARVDALVATVRARAPGGWGELRVGRFVLTTGAVRPVHIDGASGLVRTPLGTVLELFGGLPVEPDFGERRYTWMAGLRVSQTLDDLITFGFSLYERRDQGALSDAEAGVDLAVAPVEWLDVAVRGAWDLITPGLADLNASVAARADPWRIEIFARRRSPVRLLPATSLFTVLGETPATTVGSSARWRAAPRLDVSATGAVHASSADVGWSASLRGVLRFDDEGRGSLLGELRRQQYLETAWTGVRVASRIPIVASLFVSPELELVKPDDPDERGDVWPWGRLSASFEPDDHWQVAVGVEAGASATAASEVRALARVSYETAVR